MHNNLTHELSTAEYVGGNNYLCIHLQKYALNIGVVYKPGHSNFSDFLLTYENQLLHKKRTIIFGDTNIDLLNSDSTTRRYDAMLAESGYKLINKIDPEYCTRETATTKTILDHVFTNLKYNNFHMAIIESSLSDHKNIYLELKRDIPPKKQKMQYEAIDFQKLYKLVETSNFDKNAYDYKTLDECIKTNIFKAKIKKYKILNQPQNEWINRKIITGITERNALWSKLKHDPNNDQLDTEFKAKKHNLARTIKNTKEKYFYQEFTKCKNKPKKMWNLINNLSNNKIVTSGVPPKLISENGTITTDSIQVYEIFNSFFAYTVQYRNTISQQNTINLSRQ